MLTRYAPKASLAQLTELGITRVISLGAPPAEAPSVPAGSCHAVQLVDDEDADLLSHLPACVAFAERAHADGASLLVACHAGAPPASGTHTPSLGR